MTLREGLARHWKRRFHHCGTCAEDTSLLGEFWFSMADECIRQMEWARSCYDWTAPTELNPPLTIAPEDWKP
jgi:hypothetical protein